TTFHKCGIYGDGYLFFRPITICFEYCLKRLEVVNLSEAVSPDRKQISNTYRIKNTPILNEGWIVIEFMRCVIDDDIAMCLLLFVKHYCLWYRFILCIIIHFIVSFFY